MATVGIHGLSKSFRGTTVLRDLDLVAGEHEFVTLLGPSGCGKTTTLRCLAGLERPEAGEIRIGGELVAAPAKKVFVPPNRRDIGMVFQSYALWPHMTVFANVAYPLRVRRVQRARLTALVMEQLDAVGMASYAQRHVTELSGGQQQRVALARAMVARPGLFLFDEPLSNLDAKLRKSMRGGIRAAHDHSGATSVYVTHDQEEAITLSDRVVVMRHGVIQQVGSPRDIYHQPVNAFVADFVGYDNILSAEVVEHRDDAVGLALLGAGAGPGGEGPVVWAARGHRPARGSRVGIAVRAEHLGFRSAGAEMAPGVGVAEGTVVTCVYAGETVEYTVELGGGSVLVRVPEGSTSAAPGDTVGVTFDPDGCVVVEGDDPGTENQANEASRTAPVDAVHA